MQVSILTDNRAINSDFLTEDGMSIHIRSKRHNVLVDTGQTDVFVKNAKKLGIALEDVDVCCLTHGHFEHCNGLIYFLEINQKAKVYASHDIFGKYYNVNNEYIGIKEELKKFQDRFVFVEEEYFIDDSLHVFTGNDKIPISSVREAGFSARSNGLMEPDDFHHEMYVLIGDKQKLMVSGCTHKGISNVMHWARFERVNSFLGGMHFSKFDMDNSKIVRQLEQTAQDLLHYHAKYFFCHCSDESLYDFMAVKLGENYNRVLAGMQFEI